MEITLSHKRFKDSLIEQNFFSESELDSIKFEIINEIDFVGKKQ